VAIKNYIYATLANTLLALNPQAIRAAVTSGNIDKAVKLLLEWSGQQGDNQLETQCVQLSGRWHHLKNQELSGTISYDNLQLGRSQIMNSILQTLPAGNGPSVGGAVPPPVANDPVPAPTPSPSPVSPTPTPTPAPVRQAQGPPAPAPTPAPSPAPPTNPPANGGLPNTPMNNRTAMLVGLGLMAAVVGLIVFIPCPSSSQYQVFHVLLSLAAAGIGAIIPGFITYQATPALRGGGALALFLLVFFSSPEKSMAEGNCNTPTEPFIMTLALNPVKPSANYPDYDPTIYTPQLWAKDQYLTGDPNANLVVDFKNVPADLLNERTKLRLLKPETSPWALVSDSVLVKPSGQEIRLEPSGKLGKLEGWVRDTDRRPLAGAIVSFRALRDTTDATGRFVLTIPLDQQRLEYPLETVADGYKLDSRTAYTNSDVDVRLERK